MTEQEIDLAVWTTVRKGPRSGTAVSPGVVYARTETRITTQQCNQAVDRLVAAGCLYWRGVTVHRRLIAGPRPRVLPDQQPPDLFTEESHG